MAQGFVTGFAFVYVLEQLTENMAKKAEQGGVSNDITGGRQALEGAVASKGTGGGLMGKGSPGRTPLRGAARKGTGGRFYGTSTGLYKPH